MVRLFHVSWRVVYNHWTTGLSLKKIDFSTFGQLVVANVTLNVKYAGEPVYLALSLDIIAIV